MKLVRYGDVGREKPGLVDAGGKLRDLSAAIDDLGGPALRPEGLAKLKALDPAKLPPVSGNPRFGVPVAGIGKIVAIGLNYSDHAAESNLPVPKEPIIFMKATSSLSGPNDRVVIPKGSEKSDWEVELAVVIGKPASYVSEAEALSHVAGYLICNDVSERAYQIERGGQWDKGKGCDTFCPLGPWLVTGDEIKDPQALDMWLDVNGQKAQRGNTRTMVFGVAHIVSYVSQFMSLQTGDVITTGTPPGVGMGMKPPRYLKPGDVMTLGIQGLGEQRQECVAWGR
ncbi:MAG TPA: fumarylacetoacetate hydrolase family protein [Hypericibacter adhaerens]|jgi:2-keto-4-pentenoate hydratase/2-oxohepta-3-ene-1,7-dioic acid hydratase in catechol pathway|uniref:fumarylacetoacetate hydrolase family protein n=1 Tax=Hypericibacter adhaerens TaxID=2602016 RepID=UPI002CC5360F|nr:fumarylacetoacetate hydrolase family protein [Hypericibacter adhaerens]HWA45779.1 fumarylacetoacetate hydrolase family protein [Hypericibacter adhaerens]